MVEDEKTHFLPLRPVAVVFVPESPRWLLTQGKHDEALEVLRAAATRNRKNPLKVFPPGTIILIEEEENHNLCTLFRPEWRWTTITLWCKILLVLSFCLRLQEGPLNVFSFRV